MSQGCAVRSLDDLCISELVQQCRIKKQLERELLFYRRNRDDYAQRYEDVQAWVLWFWIVSGSFGCFRDVCFGFFV